MRVHNFLPTLLECLRRWDKVPTLREFSKEYYAPHAEKLDVVFDRAKSLYSVLEDLNWEIYREETLKLDPERESARLARHIQSVERYFGLELGGEAILFGAFACMDGYARFEKGSHQVFLGVDESHARGSYLDVLLTHELTHVARESQREVWTGFGLDPKMTHDEFTENLPVIEHLMNEGFSCAVSEVLVPGEDPFHYAYQSDETLKFIEEHGAALDRGVHAQIALGASGDYSKLYNRSFYKPPMPDFAHYTWAWQWVKALARDEAGGDLRKLVNRCSKDFIPHALAFKLGKVV